MRPAGHLQMRMDRGGDLGANVASQPRLKLGQALMDGHAAERVKEWRACSDDLRTAPPSTLDTGAE